MLAEDDGDEDGKAVRRPVWRYAPIVLILAGLAIAYALGLHEHLSLDALGASRQALRDIVAAHPVAAPAVFVALYALAVVLCFPAPSLLALVGGFLFGWLAGAIYAVIAASGGATLLFLSARSAFGGALRARAGSAAARMAAGFERDAFGYLLVLRIAPFMPFILVTIVPALLNVRLRTFIAATMIGVLPGAFTYAWLGAGIDSVLTAARAAGRQVRVADLVTTEITIAFALLALAAAGATVLKRALAARAG